MPYLGTVTSLMYSEAAWGLVVGIACNDRISFDKEGWLILVDLARP